MFYGVACQQCIVQERDIGKRIVSWKCERGNLNVRGVEHLQKDFQRNNRLEGSECVPLARLHRMHEGEGCAGISTSQHLMSRVVWLLVWTIIKSKIFLRKTKQDGLTPR